MKTGNFLPFFFFFFDSFDCLELLHLDINGADEKCTAILYIIMYVEKM